MALTVVKPDAALTIGILYRKARGSVVDSVRYLIEAGQLLTKEKESKPHGQWLPWLADNEDALGFGERTARLLMAAANRKLASDLTEGEALQIGRTIWGHTPRKLPKPEPEQRDDDLPPDYEGSADPEASADVMKARFASMDEDESGDDDNPIPDITSDSKPYLTQLLDFKETYLNGVRNWLVKAELDETTKAVLANALHGMANELTLLAQEVTDQTTGE